MERIGEALGANKSTVSHYLDGICAPRTNVKEDRGTDTLGRKKSTGRPKGQRKQAA